MKSIDQVKVEDKKVLVRLDLNVPLDDTFKVTDQTRIKATVPTVKKLLDEGASVILMSHLGRPKNGPENKFSLRHIVTELEKAYGAPVKFAEDCIGKEAKDKVNGLNKGEVLLLENVRFHKGETKGDEDFAKQMAELADVYVNDAFGTAHREHASTAVVARFFEEKAAGYVIKAELDNAKKVLEKPSKPFTAIMGGAKISDKIAIIERLLPKVDNLLIGGAMSYTFFKALGGNVGKSLVEDKRLDMAKNLISSAEEQGVNLMLPEDSICGIEFKNDTQISEHNNKHIPTDYMGLDIGPKARAAFANTIKDSQTILWNGPMGVFEMENFAGGTKKIAEAVAEATKGGAFSLIGGGDSAAAVNSLGYGDDVSYVSTGGGALLELMEGKTLPGIAALEN